MKLGKEYLWALSVCGIIGISSAHAMELDDTGEKGTGTLSRKSNQEEVQKREVVTSKFFQGKMGTHQKSFLEKACDQISIEKLEIMAKHFDSFFLPTMSGYDFGAFIKSCANVPVDVLEFVAQNPNIFEKSMSGHARGKLIESMSVEDLKRYMFVSKFYARKFSKSQAGFFEKSGSQISIEKLEILDKHFDTFFPPEMNGYDCGAFIRSCAKVPVDVLEVVAQNPTLFEESMNGYERGNFIKSMSLEDLKLEFDEKTEDLFLEEKELERKNITKSQPSYEKSLKEDVLSEVEDPFGDYQTPYEKYFRKEFLPKMGDSFRKYNQSTLSDEEILNVLFKTNSGEIPSEESARNKFKELAEKGRPYAQLFNW